MKYVILLHTCLIINSIRTLLNNQIERLNIYKESLTKWVNNTDYNILIIENSNNGDLFKQFIKESDRVEILTFIGNNYDTKLGKGYGERLSINYGINNTKKFKDIDKYFIITGRYYIYNIHEWISKLNDNVLMITKPIIMKRNGKWGINEWMYSECKFMTKNIIINYYNNIELNDSKIKYAEHALLECTKQVKLNNSNSVLYLDIPLYVDSVFKGTSNELSKNILFGDKDEIATIKIYCIFHDILNPKLYDKIVKKENRECLDFFYTGTSNIKEEYLEKLSNYKFIYENKLKKYNKKLKEYNPEFQNYYKCYSALFHILKSNLYHYDYFGAISFKFSITDLDIYTLRINKANNNIYYYESLTDLKLPLWNEWPQALIDKYSSSNNIYQEMINRCNQHFNKNYTLEEIINWENRPLIVHGFTGCVMPLSAFKLIRVLLLNNIFEWGAYMERLYSLALVYLEDYLFVHFKKTKNHTNYFKHKMKYIKDNQNENYVKE